MSFLLAESLFYRSLFSVCLVLSSQSSTCINTVNSKCSKLLHRYFCLSRFWVAPSCILKYVQCLLFQVALQFLIIISCTHKNVIIIYAPYVNYFSRTQMAAIFPVLDMYSCIATKWTRHLGFCISYTALLMKTWRYETQINNQLSKKKIIKIILFVIQ